MCSPPKPPKVEKTPVRQAAIQPNNGQPEIRAQDRARRQLSTASMIFANRGGTLGAPTVTNVLGV